ncbi:hypothetical protein [Neobacillus sp. LXY-1]|uniref:hypothetical protein n=1 Tax=Neobacillus sp. LXY-1 TaxID=3379133 RepID=UPI003EE32361
MIHFINSVLNKISNGKTVIVLLTVTLSFMAMINLVNLPVSVQRIDQISNGAGILDMKFYFTNNEAYQLLDTIQPDGRRIYLHFLLFFDMIFPFLYSLSLAVVSKVIYHKVFQSNSHELWTLIPFVAGIFDYMENLTIMTLLKYYPRHLDFLASLAGYLTAGKWIFSVVSLLNILLALLYMAWRYKVRNLFN